MFGVFEFETLVDEVSVLLVDFRLFVGSVNRVSYMVPCKGWKDGPRGDLIPFDEGTPGREET